MSEEALQELVVAVHPWFREGETYQPFKIWAPEKRIVLGSYLENLNVFLRNNPNVILLEHPDSCEKSKQRVLELTSREPRIIETNGRGWENSLDWDSLAKIAGQKPKLVGGYVLESKFYPYDPKGFDFVGCLGIVHGQLAARGLRPEFVSDCCYTWPE